MGVAAQRLPTVSLQVREGKSFGSFEFRPKVVSIALAIFGMLICFPVASSGSSSFCSKYWTCGSVAQSWNHITRNMLSKMLRASANADPFLALRISK